MKTETEQMILMFAALTAVLSAQPFIAILLIGFAYIWEDAKWPAFDSQDYDQKMMSGALKPWKKGI